MRGNTQRRFVVPATVRCIEHAVARAAGVTTHQIELNGTKIRSNSGEEVWIYRHPQSDDTRSASILHGANANDRKGRRFILLQKASEKMPIGSNFYQQPLI